MSGQRGLPKDEAQAVKWYRKAAEAGYAPSMVDLGFMYQHGRGGLSKDDAQAVSWFRKAAEAGEAPGMAYLGFMYAYGRGGLPKDDAQAVSWYKKAAAAGTPPRDVAQTLAVSVPTLYRWVPASGRV